MLWNIHLKPQDRALHPGSPYVAPSTPLPRCTPHPTLHTPHHTQHPTTRKPTQTTLHSPQPTTHPSPKHRPDP